MKFSSSPVLVRNALCVSLLGAGCVLAATPAQQQAIVQSGVGGPEVMKLETIPVPEPGANQVLVRVYASAVNPSDWKARKGLPDYIAAGTDTAKIRIVEGQDIAGVVEKVGPGVTELKVGDPVFGVSAKIPNVLNGGYAQYAVAAVNTLVRKPPTLTYGEAAGLGVAGVTGVRNVMETKVGKGQRLLITGVAGGVGSVAAQAAKAHGAYVIGTAQAVHNAYLKSLGVDEVIDYTKVQFEDKVKNVDAVIDTVGADTADRAFKSLKKGGMYISVGARNLEAQCAAAGAHCVGRASAAVVDRSVYDELGALAGAGRLKVKIDKTFPLAQAGAAQSLSEEGHTEGKIILIIDPAKASTK